jgi:hypothetical protein
MAAVASSHFDLGTNEHDIYNLTNDTRYPFYATRTSYIPCFGVVNHAWIPFRHRKTLRSREFLIGNISRVWHFYFFWTIFLLFPAFSSFAPFSLPALVTTAVSLLWFP